MGVETVDKEKPSLAEEKEVKENEEEIEVKDEEEEKINVSLIGTPVEDEVTPEQKKKTVEEETPAVKTDEEKKPEQKTIEEEKPVEETVKEEKPMEKKVVEEKTVEEEAPEEKSIDAEETPVAANEELLPVHTPETQTTGYPLETEQVA